MREKHLILLEKSQKCIKIKGQNYKKNIILREIYSKFKWKSKECTEKVVIFLENVKIYEIKMVE